MQFALFHSPLVGPTTWRWVAGSLVAAGHDVAVPDLRDAAVSGDRGVMIAAAATAIPRGWSTLVLVGHSGFGSILPSVAERLAGHSLRIVFVDAGLPPCEGSCYSQRRLPRPPSNARCRGCPTQSGQRGGARASWRCSCPPSTAESSSKLRCPRSHSRSSSHPFDVHEGWCQTRGSFLLLSEPYRDDAKRARLLGWPTVDRLGGHVDIANDPDRIAGMIVELAT
jgi:hypothetical protein